MKENLVAGRKSNLAHEKNVSGVLETMPSEVNTEVCRNKSSITYRRMRKL